MAVIGGILIDHAQLPIVKAVIEPTDFQDDLMFRTFVAMDQLIALGKPIDMLLLEGMIQPEMPEVNVFSTLAEIMRATPCAKNAYHYAMQMRSLQARKRLSESLAHIQGLNDFQQPLGEIIDLAQTKLQTISAEVTITEKKSTMSTMLSAVVDEISNAIDGEKKLKINTGYKQLDDLLQGIRAGQLIVLAARPSMGKTTLALNIMQNAMLRQDKRALLFSFEMGEDEITKSLIAMTGCIPLSYLKDDKLNEHDGYMSRFAYAVGELDKAKIETVSTGSTIGKVKAYAYQAKKLNPDLSLIVIDYLQLMTKPKTESRVHEISAITRELKLLAKELELPIIVLSQLNRNSEGRVDKTPVLSDLRDSGSIEQDADTVLFIHRNAQNARVIVGKNRSGAVGVAELFFDGSTATFRSSNNG